MATSLAMRVKIGLCGAVLMLAMLLCLGAVLDQ
jgi:hypothetical protein